MAYPTWMVCVPTNCAPKVGSPSSSNIAITSSRFFQLIQRGPLGMRPRKDGNVSNIEPGVGTSFNNGGKRLHVERLCSSKLTVKFL